MDALKGTITSASILTVASSSWILSRRLRSFCCSSLMARTAMGARATNLFPGGNTAKIHPSTGIFKIIYPLSRINSEIVAIALPQGRKKCCGFPTVQDSQPKQAHCCRFSTLKCGELINSVLLLPMTAIQRILRVGSDARAASTSLVDPRRRRVDRPAHVAPGSLQGLLWELAWA